MNLDKILIEEVGQFGKYQKVTIAFLSVIVIFFAFASNEYEYTTTQTPHRCRIPICDGMPSDVPYPEFRPSWLLNAINGESVFSFDSCTRFADNTSSPSSNETCPAEWFDRKRVIDCDEYVYENTNTAVYDFDLACNERRRTILDSYSSLFALQTMIQAGAIADNRGRRLVLIISVFIAGCLGFVRSFITSYIWFLIMRILQIGFGCSAFVLSYVLGIEIAGPNKRVLVGAILSTMIPLGQIILSLFAWVSSWRTLLLIIFAPQLLTMSYFYIIPESVRWLICKEQYTQSEVIIRKIAKVNKKDISDKTLNNLQTSMVATKSDDKKNLFYFIRLILKTPGIVPRIFMNLIWYVTYGAIENAMEKKTVNLTAHSYLNQMYVTAFAIMGIWTAAFLLDRIGRKRVLISGYLLCAACQFAFAFMPEDTSTWSTIVYLLDKYFLALVTSSVNLYSIELFPTEYRGTLFGYFSMHTILGQKLGALMSTLGPMSWTGLPSVLFSCMAIISALLVVFAPETRSTKLPDTMEEAAQFGNER